MVLRMTLQRSAGWMLCGVVAHLEVQMEVERAAARLLTAFCKLHLRLPKSHVVTSASDQRCRCLLPANLAEVMFWVACRRLRLRVFGSKLLLRRPASVSFETTLSGKASGHRIGTLFASQHWNQPFPFGRPESTQL